MNLLKTSLIQPIKLLIISLPPYIKDKPKALAKKVQILFTKKITFTKLIYSFYLLWDVEKRRQNEREKRKRNGGLA